MRARLADPWSSGFWAGWGWFLGSGMADPAGALVGGLVIAGLALLANAVGASERDKPAGAPEDAPNRLALTGVSTTVSDEPTREE